MSEDKKLEDLVKADFEKLSPEQLKVISEINAKRGNDKAYANVKAALKDKTTDIVGSLTISPFVYVSEKIRVMAGLEVKFATPIVAQVNDTSKELDDFIRMNNPGDQRVVQLLNKLLLAHSLVEVNGSDFGGVSFDAEGYSQLRKSSPTDANDVLEELRTERLNAIEDMNPIVVDRLIAHYRAFQTTVENAAGGEEAEEALGN